MTGPWRSEQPGSPRLPRGVLPPIFPGTMCHSTIFRPSSTLRNDKFRHLFSRVFVVTRPVVDQLSPGTSREVATGLGTSLKRGKYE